MPMFKIELHINQERWDNLSLWGKLNIRWLAFKAKAKVKPNNVCPYRYVYVLDPNFLHQFPTDMRVNTTAAADPLTRRHLIEMYGKLTIGEATKGKITWMSDA